MMTLLRHRFDAMGTTCSVAVTTPVWAGARARVAVEAALAEVAAQERALSRFDPASELSRMNQDPRSNVPVSATMSRFIEAALAAASITGGLVDPTLVPEIENAGSPVLVVPRGVPVRFPLGIES